MLRNTTLEPSEGSSPAPSPSTTTPGSAPVSTVKSLARSRARARQSKLGPMLATVAGECTVTFKSASQSEGGRHGVGVHRHTGRGSGTGYGPIGLLEAVAGEDADDGGARLEAALRRQPEQPGHRRRGCQLGEKAFAGDATVGGQ